MILRSEVLADRLDPHRHESEDDPFVITPQPNIEKLRMAGSASIDLRLGCWFAELRRGSNEILDIRGISKSMISSHQKTEAAVTKKHYVPFGSRFILHPRSFVLGVTLEWMRLPGGLAGYVTSRSSWGRRGLIIATASGVHPGFSGCLTLELTNVGEVPIALYPGTDICQFFVHDAPMSSTSVVDQSRLIGKRNPGLGEVGMDEFAEALAKYGTGSIGH